MLFEDPLCPTCKAFHQRLSAEGILEKLDTTLVLFPLDNACNWMLDRPVHPGSCIVSKAVLCAEQRAMQVLEWAYDNQDHIKDMAAAFNEKPEFYEIKFIGRARPLVLERSAVEAARARIKARYNVLEEQNLVSTETSPAP